MVNPSLCNTCPSLVIAPSSACTHSQVNRISCWQKVFCIMYQGLRELVHIIVGNANKACARWNYLRLRVLGRRGERNVAMSAPRRGRVARGMARLRPSDGDGDGEPSSRVLTHRSLFRLPHCRKRFGSLGDLEGLESFASWSILYPGSEHG
jgi:hypothetical protein